MLTLSMKQPGETIPGVYLDFKNRLLPDEIISSATVTCTIPGMVVPDSVQKAQTVVSWTITGGANGDKPIFNVVVVGSMGSVREAEVTMAVKES